MRSIARLLPAALLALSAVACGPSYDETDFQMRTAPPAPASIQNDHFTVTEGIAVGFIATPMSGKDPMDGDFRLETGDSTILGVARGNADHSFVVWGVAPGTTTVRVRLDGKVEAQIPATVVAQ
jgi:hypothetical protein